MKTALAGAFGLVCGLVIGLLIPRSTAAHYQIVHQGSWFIRIDTRTGQSWRFTGAGWSRLAEPAAEAK